MNVYAPTIFAISSDPHICSGSRHLFNMFKWARDLFVEGTDFTMTSEDEDEDDDMEENIVLLKDLKVSELKNELEIRNLAKSGLKPVLTDRLQKYLEENGLDPETYNFNVENPDADEEESENETAKDWKQFLKSFLNNNWFCHIGKHACKKERSKNNPYPQFHEFYRNNS